MASQFQPDFPVVLEPLPYQLAIRDFLKSEESEVWEWFASNPVRDEQIESVRFDLLKSTYRLDPAESPSLYQSAEEIARQLGLDVPITLYQAQNPAGLNASLAYVPGEAHIVLHGAITERLTDAELRALLAHELAHLFLWQNGGGELLIVDQILSSLTHDELAEPVHFNGARLFRLYNEVFCDRAALHVAGDVSTVVSMLVKIETGLVEVSAASYLRQADEIFAKGPLATRESTHPEAFIRARALRLWSDDAADAVEQICGMIEGTSSLDDLDLLGQRRVALLTRQLLDTLLRPAWFHTDLVQAHLRSFFDDYQFPQDDTASNTVPVELTTADVYLHDFFCFILMDFATVDRSLEELPLAAALTLGEQLGVKERLAEIAIRELRLRKRQFEKLDREKTALLASQSHVQGQDDR